MTMEKHNPYAPPVAAVGSSVARGSAVKAVIVGLAVDIGGSLVSGIILTVVYGFNLAASGGSLDQIESSMKEIPADSWFSIAGMVVGCAFSVLGGYLCARIAKHSEYRLGGIMAAISIAVALLIGAQSFSPGVNVLLSIATLASVMLGVWFGASKNKRGRT
jgi:hypothetical protein